MTELMTKAEYARRVGKSKTAIRNWELSGMIKMQGDMVDVQASDDHLARNHINGRPVPKKELSGLVDVDYREVEDRLAQLDWNQSFAWDEAALLQRAKDACACVGFKLLDNGFKNDGLTTHGGYQVRSEDGDIIQAGYGFELDLFDVIVLCRENALYHLIDGLIVNDGVLLGVDLLPSIALPIFQHQTAESNGDQVKNPIYHPKQKGQAH